MHETKRIGTLCKENHWKLSVQKEGKLKTIPVTLSKMLNALSLLLLISQSFSFSAKADTITVWGEYHPPLNGNPGDVDPGFMIEIAQLIFAKNGHDMEYILGPRSRGVKMVQDGEIDCVVNAKIKDHHYLAFPDEPWGYHAATLFALPDSNFKYTDVTQMEDVFLGAIADLRYDNGLLDEYIESGNENIFFAYGENAMSQQVKKLLKGRTDVMVSCPLLMRGQLDLLGVDASDVKVVGEIKPFVGMFLACGSEQKRTQQYIAEINETLPKLRASGELQTILDKYGQIDWLELYQTVGQQ